MKISRMVSLPPKCLTIFKKMVEHLVLPGVLERKNYSALGVQSFSHLKPKTNQVIFLSYFRNLNKKLKLKPYPIPNINFLKM